MKGVDLVKYNHESIERHNYYRKMHSAPALTYSPEIAKRAQEYAQHLADTDSMKHSDCKFGDKSVGENLAMCGGMPMTPNYMTDMWYNEVKDYNFAKGDFGMDTGHFTQVVWKDTKEAGFGLAQAKSGSWYAVGNYYPPGNYMGCFQANVFPKASSAGKTVQPTKKGAVTKAMHKK